MANVCLITGDHLRHRFYAARLIASGQVSAWVVEKREEFVPSPPVNIDGDLQDLFVHHFRERDRIENLVFGESQGDVDVEVLEVSNETLNDASTIEFLKRHNPKLVLSYGCHKLKQELINSLDARFWNSHGGLSPEYRGVITHFWPSYFLEPQMTGVTLHETTDFLDGGALIFQTAAPMVAGDSLHRLAARNVEIYAEQLSAKLSTLDFDNLPAGVIQKGYGRVFMGKDWRPEHLRLVYEVYDDRIVDAVIDGRLTGREPDLISVI